MTSVLDPIRSTDWLKSKAALLPFTLAQYHQMIRDRLLPEGAPLEFIDGLLVMKDRGRHGDNSMTMNPSRSVAIQKLSRIDAQLARFGFHMRTQQPLTLPPGSEPDPDGANTRGALEAFGQRHPVPEDVACVIEVADSSFDYDRTTKQRLHAIAGIPQYVLVNLVALIVEVMTLPDRHRGAYASSEPILPAGTVLLELGNGQFLPMAASQFLP